MAKTRDEAVSTLSSCWSAPATLPTGEAGKPLVCVATTYTFHASFFESELLPRFLGLKFDETEALRAFAVEREQALAMARVFVLVDALHFDPSQSTLRWAQLPAYVPRGAAQHSKVTLLAWERCVRVIVASANVTRNGCRRNREVFGVLDFYDDETSVPRRVLLDVLDFLSDVVLFVRAPDAAVTRLRESLEDVRGRVRAWRQMRPAFTPLERPRVTFVGGLPRRDGSVARSPLNALLDLWGTRRASEIAVMTPFVGDLERPVDPVVTKLMQVLRTRDAEGGLMVPGQPSEADARRMLVGLPRRFLDAWAAAWRVKPDDVPTYIIPINRKGEKVNRDLHAKAVLVTGEGATLLLCGSSNFTPHGMGVGVANVEANLCYFDDADVRRNGRRLAERLPVDWTRDRVEGAVWQAPEEPIEDERPGSEAMLPSAFLWAAYNQRTAVLIVAVDPQCAFPAEWSLRWPGDGADEMPPLIDHRQHPAPPASGRITIQLPRSLRGANLTALRLIWRDENAALCVATLPVHIESVDDLLPPEEFRSLTAAAILDCLLSGHELADWVDIDERRQSGRHRRASDDTDSLRTVDTTGYVLYRTRRLGAALAVLGERLLRTVRTHDAFAYRLRHDPLGPLLLAEALGREWRDRREQGGAADVAPLVFMLAEIMLVLAHVGARVTEASLQPLFRESSEQLDRLALGFSGSTPLPTNLKVYVDAVRSKAEALVGGNARHAG